MGKWLAVLGLITAPLAQAQIDLLFTHENKAFAQVFAPFTAATGIQVKASWVDQANLKLQLLREADGGQLPDAVVMPADHVGLHEKTRLAAIPADWFDPAIPERARDTTRVDGAYYGIPLLMGNHLLLYYNKALVTTPVSSWEQMRDEEQRLKPQGVHAIRWSFAEMYWFVPFLGAFGGWPMDGGQVTLNTPAMARTLAYYWQLQRDGLVPSDCDYDCAFNAFIQGQAAYSYNGIWAHNQYLQALGDNLGIAPLPTAGGNRLVPMYSSIAIAFPNMSAESTKRQQLRQLALYLQSEQSQRLMWQVVKDFPAHQQLAAEIAASASGNTAAILAELKQARAMPSDSAMAYAWEAMGKGFTRFGANILSAEQAASLMQQLADKSVNAAQSK